MKNTRIAHRLSRVLAPVSLAVLLFGPSLVRAAECPASSPEDPQERRKLAKEWFANAEAAESVGNNGEATRAYACSYKMVAHPFTAYNLGRVAERIGSYDLALKMYKAYLTLKPDANDADDVKNKVKALEERLAGPAETTTPPTEAGTAEETTEKPAEPAPEALSPPPQPKTEPAGEATKPVARESGEGAPHLVEWVVGGASAAALLGGIILNVASRNKMDACRADSDKGKQATALNECNAAPALAYWSYTMFGAAAVGAALDAYLIFRGSNASSGGDDTSVGFMWLPSGGGLSARGRF
jgi:tetratricopeptide (TPR) repeat protein